MQDIIEESGIENMNSSLNSMPKGVAAVWIFVSCYSPYQKSRIAVAHY